MKSNCLEVGKSQALFLAFLASAALLALVSRGPILAQVTATADSDGDGIPDVIENGGIDYVSNDGSHHHLDLKGLGASPQHKDVLVWIDWMGQTNSPRIHNHKPQGASLQSVKNSFLNSIPAELNPDGSKGINLIVIVSPDPILHQPVLGGGDEASIWAALDKIRNAHFPAALVPYFHYCLFAHDIGLAPTGTSGISRGIPAANRPVRSCTNWDTTLGCTMAGPTI